MFAAFGLLFLPICGCVANKAGDSAWIDPDFNLALTLDASHPASVLVTGTGNATCTVEWAANGKTRRTAPTVEGADLSALLIGAGGGVDVSARLLCAGGESAPATITTGDFPDGQAQVGVATAMTGMINEEYFLTSGFTAGGAGSITINDLDGNPVWWELLPTAFVPFAHYDPDAQVVYGIINNQDDQGLLLIAGLSGPSVEISVPDSHHDARALGGGQYLVTQRVEEDTDRYGNVDGDMLSIVDAASGAITPVWNAFDHLQVIQNDGWALSPPDWTHINGLSIDTATDKLLISLYWEHAIVQIDMATWEDDWQMGGSDTQFVEDVEFGPQHAPLRAGNQMLMFNNGQDVIAGSNLAEYVLTDPGTLPGTAVQTWSWSPDPAEFCATFGNVSQTDDALISSFGDVGKVRIFSANRDMIAEYDARNGTQAGFTEFVNLP